MGKVWRCLGCETDEKYQKYSCAKQREVPFPFCSGHGLYQKFPADQGRQIPADALDDTDGQKQHQENGAHLLKFPPGNLFIQDQANAASAYIAQDGTLAYVGFQKIQGIGQV